MLSMAPGPGSVCENGSPCEPPIALSGHLHQRSAQVRRRQHLGRTCLQGRLRCWCVTAQQPLAAGLVLPVHPHVML